MNSSTKKAAKPKMTVKNGKVYGDALSAEEKKKIVMQKKKDRKSKKVRKSAQQTIPYVAVSYTHLSTMRETATSSLSLKHRLTFCPLSAFIRRTGRQGRCV